MAARGRELQGVRDQVVDRLAQPVRVSGGLGQRVGIEPQFHAALLRAWTGRVHALLGHARDVERPLGERQAPSFRARREQHVVHQALKADRVAPDHAEEAAALLRIEVAILVLQQLEVADDRGERGAQLV